MSASARATAYAAALVFYAGAWGAHPRTPGSSINMSFEHGDRLQRRMS
ncbi:hypothetical protein [Dictyobacter aurantiacus]|nr:hypothetical protein [Dictyobacter aurantiacus]